MAECLTPAEIEGLLADTLPPENKARAEDHLASCSKCRALVERYRSDNDLLGQLQQLGPAETVAVGGGGEAGPNSPVRPSVRLANPPSVRKIHARRAGSGTARDGIHSGHE